MIERLKLLALAGMLAAGAALAQAPATTPNPSAGGAVAEPTPVPQAQAPGGIRSQNIFEVKPEASSDPNYLNQSNAERQKVQPGNNAPMWRQVGQGVTGYSSLPVSQAPEAGNLIQPFVQYPGSRLTNAGEAWRQVRNNWIIPYGAALLFVVLLAIAIYYFTRGTIRLHGAETGRKIERFTPFERATHWSNAIAFVTLAVSGIVMAFGKFFLLPIIGAALFGWLTYALKTIHNIVGPLFVVTLVLMFFTFVRDNVPRAHDVQWVMKAGGLFSRTHEPPSHRFNAGEKVVFWGGVLVLGSIVAVSGLFLDRLLPGFVYTRGEMQIALMVHGVATVLMMAMILGHIYIGTLGMAGAYDAMRHGYVDETWAREHHAYWYEDVAAGKIPAQRSKQAPAQAPVGPVRVEGNPS
ncbi:formate dehydrogenase subunit gamma [Variovorax defluvii]|uniref:Formate dehydrogenase subunit gamma n=1 Tax=Variovorax defluvii TaxID=913761 RepID=A0ABP8GWK6_9BURK